MMTVDNIKKSIIDYIKEDRRQQAILLDGPWGCGKTAFREKYSDSSNGGNGGISGSLYFAIWDE